MPEDNESRFFEQVSADAFEFHTCISCTHYTGKRTCAAYPEEIPATIWNNQRAHSKVRKDQIGDYIYVEAR